MKKIITGCLLICLFSPLLFAQKEIPYAGKILLLPIDDRPAVAQFAVMIGAIADYQICMPPMEMLGRFTTPGDTEKIGAWLRNQDYSKVDALILSIDMLAYGGLIASRSPRVPTEKAKERLQFFRWFKKKHPQIPVYAFNVLMRVAPTADASTRPWRDDLARWAELKDRAPKTGDTKLAAELAALEQKLDQTLRDDYLSARKRDLQIHLAALDLVRDRMINSLIFLQDDAREYGLHRQDQEILHKRLAELHLEKAVPVYNGADEGSLSLVSRAILEKSQKPVKVAVVYSSQKSRKVIAPFEDHPLEYTVEHQILSSGAKPAADGEAGDYTLYVNAPETSAADFQMFASRLIEDLQKGRKAALADVLFPPPHYSGADERLIRLLEANRLPDKLTGYAAWNTAGNTLGTTIPQANMRALFQTRTKENPYRAARALSAQLEFLLHRFAGDYLYHDIVRFDINRQLRKEAVDRTDEFDDQTYLRIDRLVQEQLKPKIEDYFARFFQGRKYSLGLEKTDHSVKILALERLWIRLPWPRTFEVAIEYSFAREMDQ